MKVTVQWFEITYDFYQSTRSHTASMYFLLKKNAILQHHKCVKLRGLKSTVIKWLISRNSYERLRDLKNIICAFLTWNICANICVFAINNIGGVVFSIK